MGLLTFVQKNEAFWVYVNAISVLYCSFETCNLKEKIWF